MHKLRTMHLFAGGGGGYLQTSCLDTTRLSPSSMMHIASRSWLRGRKTVTFPGFPSLLMCATSMDHLGAGLSTSWPAAFPAPTSALQARAQALMARLVGSGERWRALSTRYDRPTSLWRTARCSSSVGSHWSSVTLPKWGTMRRGVCWERGISAHLMTEIGSGYSGKRWPTPTAHNAKEGAYPAEYARNTPTLAAQAGGPLNPDWTEWLLAWPTGWSALGPLATDRFHLWLQSLGSC